MTQERIKYSEIKALNFKETSIEDTVYFNEFGYEYVIIELRLTPKIYLSWEKSTQMCEIVRIDNKRDCNILNRKPIKNLIMLREVVDFYNNLK